MYLLINRMILSKFYKQYIWNIYGFQCVFYCLKGIEDFKKVENMIELVVKYYEVKKCFD